MRVLKTNIRPEVRHEILNIDISSVSELRENSRRREAFLEDVKSSHGYNRVTPFKQKVSELIQPDPRNRSTSEDELKVGAFALVCWNCREEGHWYQDSLAESWYFVTAVAQLTLISPVASSVQKT